MSQDILFYIAYGTDRLALSLPAHTRRLQLQEQQQAINPVLFQKRLAGFLRLKLLDLSRPVLVLGDKTRLCGYPHSLPLLVSGLEQHGMDSANLKIIIGYGIHARQSAGECRQAYRAVYDQFAFIHHDCQQEDGFKEAGRTSRGTPIRFRRDLLEASVRAVSHHYFAGHGGGRKLVFPGCGERDAIYINHGLYLDRAAGTIAKGCQPIILDGSPLAEDLFEIEEKLPADLAIHGILDCHGGLSDILIGHGRENFLEACRRHGKNCEISSPNFDLVVASCGGFPKDINFIQIHKAIHNVAMFVRDGGLLLYGECRDGIGSKTFLPWFTMDSFDAAFKELSQHYQGNGGTALAMMTKLQRIRIGMERWSPDQVAAHLAEQRKEQTIACIANASLGVKREG